MKKSLMVITIVLGVVLVAWLWAGTEAIAPESTGERAQKESYRNETYGYAFSYPEEWEIHEYTPQAVSVGTPRGEGFDASAEVGVVLSGEEGGYESFAEFVFERGRILCAADGPNESLSCDRIETREPFTTAAGTAGELLYFQLVTTDILTGATTTSSYGPVYAFDIAPQVPESDFAALLIYPPLATYEPGERDALLAEIATSLSF